MKAAADGWAAGDELVGKPPEWTGGMASLELRQPGGWPALAIPPPSSPVTWGPRAHQLAEEPAAEVPSRQTFLDALRTSAPEPLMAGPATFGQAADGGGGGGAGTGEVGPWRAELDAYREELERKLERKFASQHWDLDARAAQLAEQAATLELREAGLASSEAELRAREAELNEQLTRVEGILSEREAELAGRQAALVARESVVAQQEALRSRVNGESHSGYGEEASWASPLTLAAELRERLASKDRQLELLRARADGLSRDLAQSQAVAAAAEARARRAEAVQLQARDLAQVALESPPPRRSPTPTPAHATSLAPVSVSASPPAQWRPASPPTQSRPSSPPPLQQEAQSRLASSPSLLQAQGWAKPHWRQAEPVPPPEPTPSEVQQLRRDFSELETMVAHMVGDKERAVGGLESKLAALEVVRPSLCLASPSSPPRRAAPCVATAVAASTAASPLRGGYRLATPEVVRQLDPQRVRGTPSPSPVRSPVVVARSPTPPAAARMGVGVGWSIGPLQVSSGTLTPRFVSEAYSERVELKSPQLAHRPACGTLVGRTVVVPSRGSPEPWRRSVQDGGGALAARSLTPTRSVSPSWASSATSGLASTQFAVATAAVSGTSSPAHFGGTYLVAAAPAVSDRLASDADAIAPAAARHIA
eukprot:CAMPEP_0183386694 /NCGR_PEP_ID=MMETSP0370-20130417/2606_1 /TAXON_ID=268820 /ORGANISM="Peridinium aciculiferum, Strain PAER-2" /LENGTH=652 /DNA_ID=CAMNT_0025565091 /DNA_START=27 /DNA_END=1980 /DNA_ORIENTATION=-